MVGKDAENEKNVFKEGIKTELDPTE